MRARALELQRNAVASKVKDCRNTLARERSSASSVANLETQRDALSSTLKETIAKFRDSETSAAESDEDLFGSEDAKYFFAWRTTAGALMTVSTPSHESHDRRRPTHTAAVAPDGTITVSSCLVTGLTLQAVLGWLRGGPALQTAYGPARRTECADYSGRPVIYLTCGCHVIDPSDLGPEAVSLCQPSHTVELRGGYKSLRVDTPEGRDQVIERTRAYRLRLASNLKAEVRRGIEAVAAAGEKIEAARAELPTLKARISAAETALAAAVTAEASMPPLPPSLSGYAQRISGELTMRLRD
jgi:hypothetical protein